LIHAEIRHIEALSDFETLRDRNTEVRATLETKREEVKEAMRHLKTTSEIGRKLRDEAANVVQASNSQPDLKEVLETTIKGLSLDELEAVIDSEKARLELTHEGSAGLVKEFEDRERQIQKLREKLEGYQNSLADYEHAINEIRGQWEPKLDALVQKISDAFSDSFARIGCAGQVSVDKVEEPPGPNGEPGGSDFDQWSIQIQVKFREHENLSLLDSHRQSGGERAVSTIFYLMALQSLSASPFRVVDEINQGMDPRNERMVHERMVDIACAPRTATSGDDGDVGGAGGSQYFLITPKLLSGLVYKPGMKVLCIVSGEHMPGDYNLVDFGRAVSRMREVSGMRIRASNATPSRSSKGRRDKGKGRARAIPEEGTRSSDRVGVGA
jgi:chromosome segregation ATPase